MKSAYASALVAVLSLAVVGGYALVHQTSASAETPDGPLYSSREKIVLTRDKATGAVSGRLEKGRIAVAYVNLWSRQTVQRANTLYTPPATITEIQPVILFSHCDLPYKFAIEQGRLIVSGSCNNPNWAEPPIEVVVLYSK